MKKSVLFLFFCFCSLLCFSQQKDYNPLLMIPYNDHQKWGWCDTLGNIVIQPEFNSCSFFHKRGSLFESEVILNNKIYSYVIGYGKISIPYLKLFYEQSTKLVANNILIVEDQNGDCGLYDLRKQKLLIDTTIIPSSVDFFNSSFLVFKTPNNPYILYNYSSKKMNQSNMNYSYWSFETRKTYYQVKQFDLEWYELNDQGDFQVTKDIFEVTFYALPQSNDNLIAKKNLLFGSAVNVKTKLSSDETYYKDILIGNDVYIVFHRFGKFGIQTKSNKSYITEVKYDFIEIDYQKGFFLLFQNGKMGIKIPRTIYPEIQAKYDYIIQSESFEVKESWGFVVFEVSLNNIKMFVGENGKEYSNLD